MLLSLPRSPPFSSSSFSAPQPLLLLLLRYLSRCHHNIPYGFGGGFFTLISGARADNDRLGMMMDGRSLASLPLRVTDPSPLLPFFASLSLQQHGSFVLTVSLLFLFVLFLLFLLLAPLSPVTDPASLSPPPPPLLSFSSSSSSSLPLPLSLPLSLPSSTFFLSVPRP